MAFWIASNLHAQDNNAEQQLMQIERRWCAAELKGDESFFERIIGADYVGTSLSGKLAGRAELLASMRVNKATMCEVSTLKVRQYGDTAIVTGRLTTRNPTFKGQLAFTHIWVMRKGAWVCVAGQSTEIAP